MTDKMREEFEKSPRFRGMDFTRSATHPEFYDSPYANGAWDGWKASREALVIELPDYTSPYYGGDHFDECQYAADCEKAIEAAGLKVKP
ncbi:hypothetical protein ACAW49_03070 [Pseudomonas sp. Env-44]|uniref:Uncharacterized protein n=1 Tax=Pseudomonas synxantha TaxID=47883 RepID=A0AAX3I500_9PSED|nr:hypothetical protein [Pseudomonas synxantha]AZE67745.1 hypothetical protein C4K01_3552 [Pseudomonas synxantha]KRP51512.1 hypothetical protein TU77_21250 [Pseudomonas synxantha]SDU19126.1 hypothetical protein SAMN05216475_1596 [Pseudomonas synxantha]VTQ97722.1 Uncharacterised protein [Pseudomonas synxantha]